MPDQTPDRTPLRALVVDYGGVLTTAMRGSFAAFTQEHDVDPEHLAETLFGEGTSSPFHLIETGSVTLDEFERALAERLRTRGGDTLEAEGLVNRMFAGLRPDEDMLDVVRRARAAGHLTGLLSNSWGNRESYQFDHFDTLFDAVVISGEVGLRKPDHEIYRLMARELGVTPEECVFVDDIAVNARAAVEVGMCAIHHTDTTATLAELAVLLDLPAA